MAFTWSTSECVKSNVCNVNPVNQDRLAWACLEVGIKDITHKNYREFHRRLRLRAKLFDIYDGLTMKTIYNCIGLVTSAKEMSRGEFYKTQISIFNRELEKELCLTQ